MKRPVLNLMLACVLVLSGLSCATTTTETASVGCDRECLRALVDQYLEAMVAGDPSVLPLAENVRYTEDTAEIPVGDGLWVGASEAPTTFKVYALDPESGQAGFYGLMKEYDIPVILALRLKIENGEISEIEHVVARRVGASGLKNLVTPRPGLITPVPPELRDSREEMLRIADLYFESIEANDGDVAPYADDCVRHENGGQTTTNDPPNEEDFGDTPEERERLIMAWVDACGCRDQINTGILKYITRVSPRRLVIVDEELGLVMGFPTFVHRGDVRYIDIENVPVTGTVGRLYGSMNLQAGEIFKIYGGEIHEVEANGFMLPYGLESGWKGD